MTESNTQAQSKTGKSVSILSIAEALGISKTTVGYVLSGQAKQRRVGEKTAQMVLEKARQMNYVPHMWARNLAKQSTGVIGVVIAGYEYNWAAEVGAGIFPVLDDENYLSMTSIHMWNSEQSDKELMLSLQRRDEAVICQPLPNCVESYRKLLDSHVPLVFISDTIEDMPEVSYVAWDSIPAARQAVKHLVETGRRKIGFIGSDLIKLRFTRGRYRAYCDVLADSGLELDPARVRWSDIRGLVRRDTHPTTVQTEEEVALKGLLASMLEGPSQPDALFFPHDSIALRVFRTLLEMGVRIPDDIALMGMGDVPIADDFGVGLSTIREPLEEIGRIAAETALELIKNGNSSAIYRLVPGSELKIRRTTC